MKILNIFNQDFDSTIVNLQQCYWSLSKSKKDVLCKKKEYNENLNTYNINKDYFSKSATGKTILDNIENRFDCYKKNFVKFLNEQDDNQNKIKKSIRSIYNKNIDLRELEEYDIIVTQDKYNELLVTLTKAHKDGLVDKEKVLELTEFKRIDFKKGSIYVKDNRVNYADCIVINEFNEILLLKRNKLDDFEADKYCLPGGHVDKGEDFEYAALRELIEETGIKAETAIFSGKYLDNKVAIHYFTIQVKKDDCNIFLDEREHQQFVWVPMEELSKYPLIKNLDKNFQEVILIPTSVINTHIASNIFSYYNNGHFIKSEDSEAIVIANEIYKSIKDGVIGEYELEKHIKESNLGTQNFIICKPSLGPIYGVKAIENIEKAHKYYFREGSPGNYKYYYTRDEYIKAKGKDQIDSKPKQDIVGQIESKLEDKINEIIKATEDAEFARTGLQISDYEKELLRLSLLQDMFNSIGKYVEETDELVAFNVNQSLKGNFTIQMNINRDGQVRHLETDVIYAGGYNIQKLHLRYITNTDLVPKSTTLTNKYKDKAAKLTKLQRLEKDVEYYEGVVERYKKEITEREAMSDEDKALAGGGYDIMKNAKWQELVERGADKNYDYSEQVFIDETAKSREDNIKRFNEYTRYTKDYLKSAEKDLAKRIQRVEEFTKNELSDNIEKSEKIKGGLADGETVEELAAHHKTSVKKIYDEIEIGKKVEMEHTDDPEEALEITMDHLWEIPDYYTRLAKMEKEAKEDKLEKGKRAEIGEIREWNGIKMQKTAQGWLPVKKDSSTSKEENDGKISSVEKQEQKKEYSEKELKEFAKKTSESDLKQAVLGGDEQLRIAAKEELERRNVEETPKVEKKPIEKTTENKDTISHKKKQLEIILNNNPSPDEIHTWIRKEEDIKTAEEAFNESIESDESTPDFKKENMENALKEGFVTIYSSYPIRDGAFVTPSKMEAQSYAGKKDVFSKKVNLDDVAWIDGLQGQFAPINKIEETKKEDKDEKSKQ